MQSRSMIYVNCSGREGCEGGGKIVDSTQSATKEAETLKYFQPLLFQMKNFVIEKPKMCSIVGRIKNNQSSTYLT